jgi:hypothetical protein
MLIRSKIVHAIGANMTELGDWKQSGTQSPRKDIKDCLVSANVSHRSLISYSLLRLS